MWLNKSIHFGIIILAVSILNCAFSRRASFLSAENFSCDQLTALALIGSDNEIIKKNVVGSSSVEIDAEIKISFASHLKMFNIGFSDYTDSLKNSLIKEKIKFAIDKSSDEINEFHKNKEQPFLNLKIDPIIIESTKSVDSDYLIFYKLSGFYQSTGSKILMMTSGIDQIFLDLFIVEKNSGNIVWFSSKKGSLNPEKQNHIDAIIQSMLLELILKRSFEPEYLTCDKSNYLSIFLKNKSRIFGRIIKFEGLTCVIKDSSGNQHHVLFDDIDYMRRGNI